MVSTKENYNVEYFYPPNTKKAYQRLIPQEVPWLGSVWSPFIYINNSDNKTKYTMESKMYFKVKTDENYIKRY